MHCLEQAGHMYRLQLNLNKLKALPVPCEAHVCHGAAAHLVHRGWDLKIILHMHKCDKIRQVLQPEGFVLGCNLPLPNVLPPARFCPQEHPINQRIVIACHPQHSMSLLVSATCCHPSPRHTERISNNQACTCFIFLAPL